MGHGLGLDPLGAINDQQSSFAGFEASFHFVGKVTVAGRVHQIDKIIRASKIVDQGT